MNFNPDVATPNPATAPTDYLYASMGLSSIGAIGNIFSGVNSAKAQGAYEAAIASTNANLAGLQSKETLEQGDLEASAQNLKTQQQVGSIRAAQGASGVDVASGSSALVRSGVSSVGAMDELTIRNNAARRAFGYQTEATEDTFKSQFAGLTAKATETQDILSGGLQAINGPLGIYSTYLRYSRYLGGSGGAGNRLPFKE